MTQHELFDTASLAAWPWVAGSNAHVIPEGDYPEDDFEEEAYHIEDDDGGIEADGDICERCECPRDAHGDDGCACGRCRKFKE